MFNWLKSLVAPAPVTTFKNSPRAKLLVALPANRYRILSSEQRVPAAGDLVVLDQGFTGHDGEPMVIAYFLGSEGDYLYEADVYESELE